MASSSQPRSFNKGSADQARREIPVITLESDDEDDAPQVLPERDAQDRDKAKNLVTSLHTSNGTAIGKSAAKNVSIISKGKTPGSPAACGTDKVQEQLSSIAVSDTNLPLPSKGSPSKYSGFKTSSGKPSEIGTNFPSSSLALPATPKSDQTTSLSTSSVGISATPIDRTTTEFTESSVKPSIQPIEKVVMKAETHADVSMEAVEPERALKFPEKPACSSLTVPLINVDEPQPSTSKADDGEPGADEEEEEDYQSNSEYEEEEEQDEIGIPLSNIAALTPEQKIRLDKMKELLNECELRIRNMDEIEQDLTPEQDKKYHELTDKSEKILSAIIKFVGLDSEDADNPSEFIYADPVGFVKPFEFRGSGNKYLDRVLTMLVQKLIEKDAVELNVMKMNPSMKFVGALKDLNPKKVKQILDGIEKRKGKPVVTKKKKHIEVQQVFIDLHNALHTYKADYFRKTVIPKFCGGVVDPREPTDRDLVEKLQDGDRDQVTVDSYIKKFEEEKRNLGFPVARDVNDEDVPEPDYVDSGADDNDDGELDDGLSEKSGTGEPPETDRIAGLVDTVMEQVDDNMTDDEDQETNVAEKDPIEDPVSSAGLGNEEGGVKRKSSVDREVCKEPKMEEVDEDHMSTFFS